jgi:hypothetical protein
MAALASVIEQNKLQIFLRNEKAIADTLPASAPLDDETKRLFAPFQRWCQGMEVRHCPATPAIVAAFIRDYDFRGPKILVPIMQAIEATHNYYRLANPVATETVGDAIAEMFDDDLADLIAGFEAPRSWSKNEKRLFWLLPKDVQQVVARREYQRELVIRQAMNEAATAKQELQQIKMEKEVTSDKLESTDLQQAL